MYTWLREVYVYIYIIRKFFPIQYKIPREHHICIWDDYDISHPVGKKNHNTINIWVFIIIQIRYENFEFRANNFYILSCFLKIKK